MKRIITAGLLIICIGTIRGVDLESYRFIDRLLSLGVPCAPVIYENTVIFTAPSSHRRVGISFAYEGYSKVYWLRNLILPARPPIEEEAVTDDMDRDTDSRDLFNTRDISSEFRNVDPDTDSGILFHAQEIPDGLQYMDYRLIIDGLWTTDPLNPQRVLGSGGFLQSRVTLPPPSRPAPSFNSTGLSITYIAAPGEIITVAGSFNGWDPFMYQMRETSPGLHTSVYTFNLPLAPGTYEYVFIHRGQRLVDPNNPNLIYTRDGTAASQAIIR